MGVDVQVTAYVCFSAAFEQQHLLLGIETPSAFAAFTLTTSSNFVGCSIGVTLLDPELPVGSSKYRR